MDNQLSFIKYGDIANFRNGLNFSKNSHGRGCLFIGVADFKDNFVPRWNELEEINPSGITKDDDYLKKGDIIFVRSNGNKALVGRSLYIDKDVPSLYSGFCIRARLTSEAVEPLFIAYFSKTAVFKSSIASAAGTNINNLNQGILSEVRIPNYSKDVQNAIIGVLSTIDKKIEINNRINAELEVMAKTLYDYWFVQFDFPDANGNPYKTSGGKMVYNATLKRELPEGWSDASLVDIATFTNGIACQKYYPSSNEPIYKVIKIREFSSGFDSSSECVRQSVPEKVVVNDGDILFSWSATLEVKLWSGGTGALNQHIFKVTSNNYPKTFYYFEVLKYLEYFKMVAELRKTTMGHITKDHLISSRISLPPNGLILEMDTKLSPILKKIVKNNQQNAMLEKLRDWLLPMLMNGQVTVQ